jgi:hypothetical protein
MSTDQLTVFSDRETLEILDSHPDLLAIADAVVATQRKRRRRPPIARFAFVAAVVALATALALVSPWQGHGSGFVERALAAIGGGQVIHVVSVGDQTGQTILDLQTGAERPLAAQTEVWFDSSRRLERTVSSVDGRVTDDELQTAQGTWTQDGRVYTCAWIAAHPVEATDARVSCNASGDNGTTPHQLAEPLPTLDPALGGFLSGYRDALANGTAQRDGSGSVDGRPVEWLRFEQTDQPPAGQPAQTTVERVAVDSQTLKPVLVDRIIGGKQVGETHISLIESVGADAADFSLPKQAPPQPTATSVTSQEDVTPPDAAAAVAGRLLWDGASVDGLPLSASTLQQIVTGYGRKSGLPNQHSQGIEIAYGGPTDSNPNADYVKVRESVQPQMLYGFAGPERQAPGEGSMLVSTSEVMTTAPGSTQAVPTGKTLWYGLLQQGGVFVSIEATSHTLLLDSARALARYGAVK